MARPKASWFDGSRKARGTENLIDILAIRGIHVIGDAERLGEASAVCAHHRSSSSTLRRHFRRKQANMNHSNDVFHRPKFDSQATIFSLSGEASVAVASAAIETRRRQNCG